VDAFRLYAMNEAYEELLTLPKVFPVIATAVANAGPRIDSSSPHWVLPKRQFGRGRWYRAAARARPLDRALQCIICIY